MNKKTSIIYLLLAVLLITSLMLVGGCKKATPTPTATPVPTATVTKTVTPVPTATATATPVPTTPPVAKTMKVGGIFAMTGAGAFHGKVMSQGVLLAVDEINAAGGIGGIKLELITEDHQSGDAKAAASAGQKLINVDKVPWIFTSYSAPTLSVQPMAAEAKVLMMNGGGVSALMLNKSFLFSTRILSNVGGKLVADYCWKQGYKKMAMVYWNDPAGNLSADAGRARWKELGGTMVAEEPYQSGATDYTANLAKIKAAKPDVIAEIGVWGKDVGFLVKQSRDMGITTPHVGVDWNADVQSVAGATLEGYRYIVDYFDVNGTDPWTQKYVKAYNAKWNVDTEIYAANYYELTYMLKACIEGCLKDGKDPFSGANLREQLLKVRTFPAISGGTLTINDDGSCIKPVGVFEIKDGKPIVIETLK